MSESSRSRVPEMTLSLKIMPLRRVGSIFCIKLYAIAATMASDRELG